MDFANHIKPYFDSTAKGSHGYNHALRVHNLGKYIAEKEGADIDVVIAACLLHDIARGREKKGEGCHAELGAKMCEDILTKLNFPKDKIPKVSYCIKVHRYSTGIEPETIEAKIVQDADRLEELGAVAISRGLIEDTLKGKPLYDPAIPPNEQYKSGDNKTNINFLKEKSLKLKPTTFHTKTAQSLAQERYQFTQTFVRRVIEEWHFPNYQEENNHD